MTTNTMNINKIELDAKVLDRLERQLKKIWVGKKSYLQARPLLGTLNYTDDGHVQFTNSHVACRLLNIHNDPNPPNEYESYPNLSKHFQITDDAVKFTLNKEDLKILENTLNTVYRFNKKGNIKLTVNSDGIRITPMHDINVKWNFDKIELAVNTAINEDIQIAIDPKYLHDTLVLFRQLKLDQVDMYFNGALRPMHFISANLEYLIVPIRTY